MPSLDIVFPQRPVQRTLIQERLEGLRQPSGDDDRVLKGYGMVGIVTVLLLSVLLVFRVRARRRQQAEASARRMREAEYRSQLRNQPLTKSRYRESPLGSARATERRPAADMLKTQKDTPLGLLLPGGQFRQCHSNGTRKGLLHLELDRPAMPVAATGSGWLIRLNAQQSGTTFPVALRPDARERHKLIAAPDGQRAAFRLVPRGQDPVMLLGALGVHTDHSVSLSDVPAHPVRVTRLGFNLCELLAVNNVSVDSMVVVRIALPDDDESLTFSGVVRNVSGTNSSAVRVGVEFNDLAGHPDALRLAGYLARLAAGEVEKSIALGAEET